MYAPLGLHAIRCQCYNRSDATESRLTVCHGPCTLHCRVPLDILKLTTNAADRVANVSLLWGDQIGSALVVGRDHPREDSHSQGEEKKRKEEKRGTGPAR